MSYLSLLELESYGDDELADVSDELAQRALDAASELIDTRLAGGVYPYALPFSPAPALIKLLCADLARAAIASGTGIFTAERREPLERREQAALKLLNSIANGEIQLGSAYLQTGSTGVLKDAQPILVSSRKRRGFG
jgi:phage gp36-like protein